MTNVTSLQSNINNGINGVGPASPDTATAGRLPQSVHNSDQMIGQLSIAAGSHDRSRESADDPFFNNAHHSGNRAARLPMGSQNTVLNRSVTAKYRSEPVNNPLALDPTPAINTGTPVAAIEPDTVVKHDDSSVTSKPGKIIRTVLAAAALTVAVTAILVPLAMVIGIPVGTLLIVQTAAIAVGILISVYAAAGPDRFALMMSKLLSKQSGELQSVAGAAVGLASASNYNATSKGRIIAAYVAYQSVKRSAKFMPIATGMAGANATGAAIGTVDTLAKGKASKPMHAGAAAGGVIGGWALGTVKGSAWVGEMAGKGAFSGAEWGKRVDEYVTAVIADPWRIFFKNNSSGASSEDSPFTDIEMDEQFLTSADESPQNNGRPDYSVFTGLMDTDGHIPGNGEWIGAMTGGLTGGVYAAADMRAGGNISLSAGAFNLARETVSFGKLVRAARNFIDNGFIETEQGARGFPCID